MQILTQWVRDGRRYRISSQPPGSPMLLFMDPIGVGRVLRTYWHGPGAFPIKSPHFLSSGFVSLLTPTGFSAPARWEQDRGRLMRSPRGRVERLSERVLPQFPCERDYPPGWAESWRGGGQAGCATGKFVPPSSFLGAPQSSVQAAFYLAL